MDLLKKIKKVCEANEDCKTCPLSVYQGSLCVFHRDVPLLWHVEEINKVVDDYLEKHKPKTRQTEFLKVVPSAFMSTDGLLAILPCDIDDKMHKFNCADILCSECRKKYWTEEVNNDNT